MKKVFMLLLVLQICVSLFAGGGRDRSTKTQNVLRMAVLDTDINRAHQNGVDYFAQKYPDIKIELVTVQNAEYVDKITVMLAGGDDVDLVFAKSIPQYVTMLSNGQLQDIMPRVKTENIDTTMYGGAIEKLTIDGKLYGLPFLGDIWLLFYNKNLFDKAGVPYPTDNMTWDEYGEMCKKLTSGSGSNKVYGGYFHNWIACVQNLAIQDGKNTVVSKNFDFFRPAYKMVLELQDKGYIMDYSNITTGNLHYSGVFYNQQAATVYQGTWFINLLLTEKQKNGLSFEWGVVKAPHPVGTTEGTVVGTVQPMGINTRARNPEMAWEYLKYIAGKEAAQYMASHAALPAAKTDAILRTFVSMDGMPKDCTSAFDYHSISLETPADPKAGIVGTILGEEHSLVMTKSITLDQFISNLNKRVSEALDE